PRPEDFDLEGLDISRETMRELFSIKPDEWKPELESQTTFFETIGQDMPRELVGQRDKVSERFGS
ncbi:MAG TPA: phosphoenolpyruvate carboxykinase domain-containing protein, partial [Thermoanaerobaculia bacterium]